MKRIFEIYKDLAEAEKLKAESKKVEGIIAQLEKEKNVIPAGVETIISEWEGKVEKICRDVLTSHLKQKYEEYSSRLDETENRRKALTEAKRFFSWETEYNHVRYEYTEKRIAVYSEQIKTFDKLRKRAWDAPVLVLNMVDYVLTSLPTSQKLYDLREYAKRMDKTLGSYYAEAYPDWTHLTENSARYRSFRRRIHLYLFKCKKLKHDTDKAISAFVARGKVEEPLLKEEKDKLERMRVRLNSRSEFPILDSLAKKYEREVHQVRPCSYYEAFVHFYGGIDETEAYLKDTDDKLKELKATITKCLECFYKDQSTIESCIQKRQTPVSQPLRRGDIPFVFEYKALDSTTVVNQLRKTLDLDGIDGQVFNGLYRKHGSIEAFESTLRGYRDKSIEKRNQLIARYKAQIESWSKSIKDLESAKQELMDLRLTDPVVGGVYLYDRTAKDITSTLVGNMQECAQNRFSLPCFVNPFHSDPDLPMFPEVIHWQESGAKKNLLFAYGEGQRNKALTCMNATLLSILAAFQAKHVKIVFIDMATSNDGAYLTTRLDGQICEVVNREQDLRQQIEKWQAKASMVGRYTSDILSYNSENQTILAPYEIAVLLNKPNSSVQAQLAPFIENGHKYGLYFFALFSDVEVKDGMESFASVKWDDNPEVGFKNRSIVPITWYTDMTEAVFHNLEEESRKVDQVQSISQDVEAMSRTPYADAIKDFAVPVGETNGREAFFRLSNQHIHSFVIGQTGQGKSVLLHDVIAGSILRYSPEQLQIYLLDFKMGEELYHYKNVKHIRALLASGSDLKVTLEIMKDLKNKMEERSNLMREVRARNLEEYNAVSAEKMPRILLVVDECQELFRDSAHRQPGEASDMLDIRNIVIDIARKGRSQGVHLLFATQTLSGTQLPPDIKNNLTDKYLFRCAQEDAEQLAPGSSKKVLQLKVGNLLHTSTCEGESTFQAYFPDVESMVEAAIRKAEQIQVGKQFVFDGKTMLPFDGSTIEWVKAKSRRGPGFALGKSLDVKQEIVGSALKAENTENILFVGYNHAHVCRASLSALFSLMLANKEMLQGYKFYCLDLLQSEDDAVMIPLDALRRKGLEMIKASQCGAFLSELAEAVRKQEEKKVVFFILGQERFKAVRDEYEIPGAPQPATDRPMGFGRPPVKTYRSELKYILENGSEYGIHILLQVDKVSNLLFEQSVMPKFVNRMFNYVCLLRCEKEAEARLGLDGIYPNLLSDEETNLAAWFINDSMGKKDKFSPFMSVSEGLIDKVL